jgi:hypothetical protein
MGNKVSDEWSVPLCFTHHRGLHTVGNEEAWWAEKGIDAKAEALRLWREGHGIPESEGVAAVTADAPIGHTSERTGSGVPHGLVAAEAGAGVATKDVSRQQRDRPESSPRFPPTHSVIVPDNGDASEDTSETSAAAE